MASQRTTKWGLSCSLLLLQVFGSLLVVVAFRPQPIRLQRRTLARPSVVLSSSSNSNNLHEFDHLLQEVAPSTPQAAPAGRRRRFAVAVGGADNGGRKTILASSAATPAPEAAEAMSSLEEGDTSAIDSGAAGSDDPYDVSSQFNKVQQYEDRQQVTMSDRFKKMDLQDIVLTLILPSIALFAAGRWGYNRVMARVNDNMETTLDSFANEMIYHDGDFEEMKMCVKDYNKRLVYLGPLKRDKMLKRYLAAFAKKKTVSPQAISTLSYAFTLFSLSEEAAAKLLVALCREMGTDKISSAGKLLFLGSRILKSPEGTQALEPIKDLIKSTYREATVAETMVETSQQAIAEASYRSAILAGGKNQKSLTVGWEVLGLERSVAERLFNEEAKEGFVSDREAMYGLQTQKYDKKGRRIDKDGELENPEEADDDDADQGDDGPVSNVYECSECGYTLFVAQGRESKFFGNDFKCPECGAPKDRFTARDDLDE